MKYFLLLIAVCSSSFGAIVAAPEIDAQSASSAVALIAGGLTVLRAARKR
jgi:hypothetical protein